MGSSAPDSPEFLAARQAFGAADFDTAADICSRLIQNNIDDAAAWNMLGWCEFQGGNRQRAIQAAAEATRYDADGWRFFYDLGYFLRAAGSDEKAAGAFGKVVELEPNTATGWEQLGATLTALGDVNNAIAAHQRAISIDSVGSTQSLLALVELDNFGSRPADLKTLERAYGTIRLGRARSHLGFALGHVWDHQKDYAKAFEYYDRANADRRRDGHLGVASKIDNTPTYLEQFNTSAMSAAPDSGLDALQPVFVVGMPRSGIALLEQLLGNHSVVAAGGESGEFSRLIGQVVRQLPAGTALLEGLDREALRATGESYLDYLRERFSDAARVTERLPLSFTLVGLISKLFPRARVLHVTRDPLDTCWSCWSTSFDNATLAFSQQELGSFYALYEHTMNHWRDVCPDALVEVSYEQLVRDPEVVMRATLETLGLAWEPACAAVSADKPISKSSIGRARAYRDRLTPLIEARETTLAKL